MISQTDQIEDVTFHALAHQTRRTIIRIVQSKSKGVSYTELLTELALSTGRLNYHLDQLKGIIEKNNSNNYILTPFGEKAVEHLNLIEQRRSSEDEKYVKVAALYQRTSLQPIMKAVLSLGIAATVFLLLVWAYIGYIAFSEGAPLVVYVILPFLLALGAGLLGILVYALAKSPIWIKRLEQRYFGEN